MENRVTAGRTKVREPKSSIVEKEATNDKTTPERGWQYWAVTTAFCVVAFLPAMEGTVVSTAAPSVIQDLRADFGLVRGLYRSLLHCPFSYTDSGYREITESAILLHSE